MRKTLGITLVVLLLVAAVSVAYNQCSKWSAASGCGGCGDASAVAAETGCGGCAGGGCGADASGAKFDCDTNPCPDCPNAKADCDGDCDKCDCPKPKCDGDCDTCTKCPVAKTAAGGCAGCAKGVCAKTISGTVRYVRSTNSAVKVVSGDDAVLLRVPRKSCDGVCTISLRKAIGSLEKGDAVTATYTKCAGKTRAYIIKLSAAGESTSAPSEGTG